ncbi:restriction endonuclease subunit S [Campylobacter molothri]|uniref:restriction endonuclease subunit S n=1 Tax=Campylobacter molothri TaxID=1032242 RepID=UPI00301BBC52|nr:restriction endonuclease subunit S [Campylobacter sp. RM9753]
MKNLKNSGIEWLGEIPEHWEIVLTRYCFDEYNTRCNQNEYPLLSVTISNGVIYQNDIVNKKDISNDDKSNYKIVPVGAITYNKMRMWQGAVGVNMLEKGIVSPAYCVAVSNELIIAKFSFYLFRSKRMIYNFGKNSYGLCLDMNNLRYEDFQNIKIPLPPLKEQEQIANFLDEKCEKIQNFIEKKEKLLSLLQEQKQALINETITKGLDKNVKLKNSGIEWLGEIPEHWEMVRLANFGIFLKGNGISRQDLIEDGEPAIHYGDIYTKYEISTTALKSRISTETAQNITSIHNGDILFAGSGETKEDIGKNIVYLGKEKAFAGGDVIIFRQKKNNALFLSYALNTKYVKSLKGIDSKGEIIVHIYASNLKDIKIPIPPLKEQEQIANFLDEKCEKIDSLITKIKKQIELIKEYKTTLINEAVCGRMDL